MRAATAHVRAAACRNVRLKHTALWQREVAVYCERPARAAAALLYRGGSPLSVTRSLRLDFKNLFLSRGRFDPNITEQMIQTVISFSRTARVAAAQTRVLCPGLPGAATLAFGIWDCLSPL
ncbi:jg17748 [Pararge aegeria aegeria]|uniref:Jg17748 protein n=1 Tax=Pararge aegeria aegeria TaxID=348720 RepID=A0A8S4S3H8_9NEOP|nr:jg17748 [Pararge aegeria aegeria]